MLEKTNDMNFDIRHEEPELLGLREKSTSKPYEMQTYLHYPNGEVYNEICEFTFDTEKTGHGYYYLLNVSDTGEPAPDHEEDGETFPAGRNIPEAPKHNPTAPELPEAVTGAEDFEYWRDLRPEDFTPAILQRFAVRFGVFISHDNGKTAIPSFNLLAGGNYHNYDGIVPAKIADEIRETAGACSGDCPGCYAKAMTRYPEAVAHYRDNTIAVRVNPEAAVAAACLIAFCGNPSILFRVHDSGDYAPSANAEINARYFAAWVRAAEEYPFIRFGSYTKEAETVEAFGIANLPANFCLSCSPWEGHCDPIGDLPQFIYDNGTNPELDTIPHCPAVDRFGNRTGVTCAECKHCYTAKRGARRAVYAHDCEGKKSLVSNLIARGIITEEAYKREVAKRKAEREAKKAAKAAKG